jgi:hypothetical protein
VNRRRFLIAGAGVVAAAAAAPYAPLVVGDEFESFVAGRLGLDPEVAAALLEDLRERLGDREYDLRAAAFALALRRPYAAVVPDGAQRSAIARLVEPLLSGAPLQLAYATGRAPSSSCGGLLRGS